MEFLDLQSSLDFVALEVSLSTERMRKSTIAIPRVRR
jgi:hypothetical protein